MDGVPIKTICDPDANFRGGQFFFLFNIKKYYFIKLLSLFVVDMSFE